jgi:hypothetical protein
MYGNTVCISTETTVNGKTFTYVLPSLSSNIYQTHLYQIPFHAFALTNGGEMVDSHFTMNRDKIRTIGIALLGGKSGVEGSYELGIDTIRAVNREDVIKPPGMYLCSCCLAFGSDMSGDSSATNAMTT